MPDIINLIRKVNSDPRIGRVDRDYQTCGTGVRFHTKQHHFIIYDKIAEVEKSLKYGNTHSLTRDNECQREFMKMLAQSEIKIIRYEVSLKRKKIKALNLDLRTLEDAFQVGMAKSVLQGFIRKLHHNLNSLYLDNENDYFIINRIKTTFLTMKHTNVMALFGYMQILKNQDYDFLRECCKLTSAQISRVRSQIREINNTPSNDWRYGITKDICLMNTAMEDFNSIRQRPQSSSLR